MVTVQNTEYLTAAEVAQRYGNSVKESTLANWRFKKVGPAYSKIGGRVLYRLADLLEWEKTQRREPVR